MAANQGILRENDGKVSMTNSHSKGSDRTRRVKGPHLNYAACGEKDKQKLQKKNCVAFSGSKDEKKEGKRSPVIQV